VDRVGWWIRGAPHHYRGPTGGWPSVSVATAQKPGPPGAPVASWEGHHRDAGSGIGRTCRDRGRTMQLGGKVALVTGAGSGIGQAAAVLMGREGAKIAAVGHGPDELEETVAAIARAGGETIPVVADVSREGDMERAVRQVADRWDRLDVVFANAGI